MRCSACIAAVTTAYTAVYAQDRPTTESLIATAAQIAQTIRITFPNPSVALVPGPYYWWQSGIVNDALFTYGSATGDKQYEDLSKNTLYNQATGANDFMMPDAHGNDDQAWWALAALTAAENAVPVPEGSPTFLSMAQNVFNEQKARWDTTTCGGGMKFKINPGEGGYNYKSSIANGLFFQLAARLAKFTGDSDALSWAEKSYDWIVSTGLIDGNFNVYDGTDDSRGCVDLNHDQWSYNGGVFLYGAAVMASQSSDSKWRDRTMGLLNAAQRNFVRNDALFETICEGEGSCNTDQVSFKGILARWIGATAVVFPGVKGPVVALLSGISRQTQAVWNPSLNPMEHYVALEVVDAAVRANGGAAAVYGMIGANNNVAKLARSRSIAGRIAWKL